MMRISFLLEIQPAHERNELEYDIVAFSPCAVGFVLSASNEPACVDWLPLWCCNY